MTSTAKTAVDADTSDLLDLTPADAGDVLYPVTDLLGHVRNGRASVSDTDTYVKHLTDAFAFGAGMGNGLGNAGANEYLFVYARSGIVPLTVLGGFAASLDFASLPATYDHLRLVLGLRTTVSATLDSVLVRCNDDAAAINYASVSANIQHGGGLTTGQALEGTTTGGQVRNTVAGGTSPAGYLGVVSLDFYEYAKTGRPRTCRWSGLVRVGNATGEIRLTKGQFIWTNTVDAITKLTVIPSSGFSFVAGTGYAVYGIR